MSSRRAVHEPCGVSELVCAGQPRDEKHHAWGCHNLDRLASLIGRSCAFKDLGLGNVLV